MGEHRLGEGGLNSVNRWPYNNTNTIFSFFFVDGLHDAVIGTYMELKSKPFK